MHKASLNNWIFYQVNNIQNLLGEVSEIELTNLIKSLVENNPESLIINCNKLYDAGNEPLQIIIGLLNITRDLLLHTTNNKYSDLYYTSDEFQDELKKISKTINKSTIINWHNNLRNIEYLSLIHIWRCRRVHGCRSRWSPYH